MDAPLSTNRDKGLFETEVWTSTKGKYFLDGLVETLWTFSVSFVGVLGSRFSEDTAIVDFAWALFFKNSVTVGLALISFFVSGDSEDTATANLLASRFREDTAIVDFVWTLFFISGFGKDSATVGFALFLFFVLGDSEDSATADLVFVVLPLLGFVAFGFSEDTATVDFSIGLLLDLGFSEDTATADLTSVGLPLLGFVGYSEDTAAADLTSARFPLLGFVETVYAVSVWTSNFLARYRTGKLGRLNYYRIDALQAKSACAKRHLGYVVERH